MTLFISILIIIGLDMSLLWLIPAVAVWIAHLKFMEVNFNNLINNQVELKKYMLTMGKRNV